MEWWCTTELAGEYEPPFDEAHAEVDRAQSIGYFGDGQRRHERHEGTPDEAEHIAGQVGRHRQLQQDDAHE